MREAVNSSADRVRDSTARTSYAIRETTQAAAGVASAVVYDAAARSADTVREGARMTIESVRSLLVIFLLFSSGS